MNELVILLILQCILYPFFGNSFMSKHITIVGGGPVGCLAAIYLAKKGHHITIYERRKDMRKESAYAGRSINLALSDRGIRGLEGAGIVQDILNVAIPMSGRMMHSVDGEQMYQAYGKEGQAINSVSRGGINIALLNCAASFDNISIHFEMKCIDADLDRSIASFENSETHNIVHIQSDCIIATDGAYSAIRDKMQKLDRFNYHQYYIDQGYKELRIPALSDGSFALEKSALHIWPRKQYMMIALPNMDGSFTCTLFFPFEGSPSFSSLDSDQKILDFFAEQFPDALSLMPTLLDDYHNNPTGSLVTMRLSPWHYKDKVLLIGDAAHAIVPFYGQGMNCGFEDCTVLHELLDAYQEHEWDSMFAEFTAKRKPNGDAIAELALNNLIEMRDLVADPYFQKTKIVEKILSELYPQRFLSLYSMVTFSHIPYADALRNGKINEELFKEILSIPNILEEWNSEGNIKLINDLMNTFYPEL